MQIHEYLQRKYKQNPALISEAEADAFGISFPVQKGWLKKHGSAEITEFMRERLKPLGPIGKLANSKSLSKPKRENIQPKFSEKSIYAVVQKSFYETKQWRILRMKVLEKYGAVCQCCGASRKNGAVIHVDHIKPRSKFPELELDINNLQVLCADCNVGKLNIYTTDWRETGVSE